MTTIVRIRTEWQDRHRYHLEFDSDASALDCCTVELPPYTVGHGLVVKLQAGKGLDDLLREALHTLDFLRSQPHTPVHPASVFIPFGVITARNFDDLQREHLIKMSTMGAERFHADARWRAAVERNPVLYNGAHERRVAELCKALDLLNGGPLPVGVPFPEFSFGE